MDTSIFRLPSYYGYEQEINSLDLSGIQRQVLQPDYRRDELSLKEKRKEIERKLNEGLSNNYINTYSDEGNTWSNSYDNYGLRDTLVGNRTDIDIRKNRSHQDDHVIRSNLDCIGNVNYDKDFDLRSLNYYQKPRDSDDRAHLKYSSFDQTCYDRNYVTTLEDTFLKSEQSLSISSPLKSDQDLRNTEKECAKVDRREWERRDSEDQKRNDFKRERKRLKEDESKYEARKYDLTDSTSKQRQDSYKFKTSEDMTIDSENTDNNKANIQRNKSDDSEPSYSDGQLKYDPFTSTTHSSTHVNKDIDNILHKLCGKESMDFNALSSLKSYSITSDYEADCVKEIVKHLSDALLRYHFPGITSEMKKKMLERSLEEGE